MASGPTYVPTVRLLHRCNPLRPRVPRFIVTSWTADESGPRRLADAPEGRPPDDETDTWDRGKQIPILHALRLPTAGARRAQAI